MAVACQSPGGLGHVRAHRSHHGLGCLGPGAQLFLSPSPWFPSTPLPAVCHPGLTTLAQPRLTIHAQPCSPPTPLPHLRYEPLDPQRWSLTGFRTTAVGRFITRNLVNILELLRVRRGGGGCSGWGVECHGSRSAMHSKMGISQEDGDRGDARVALPASPHQELQSHINMCTHTEAHNARVCWCRPCTHHAQQLPSTTVRTVHCWQLLLLSLVAYPLITHCEQTPCGLACCCPPQPYPSPCLGCCCPLQIAPKGSARVSSFLERAGDGLVAGGKTGIFTPCELRGCLTGNSLGPDCERVQVLP